MTITQQGLLTLVKSALTGEKLPISQELDLIEVLKTATKHGITTIVYYGALNCGIDSKLPEMQNLLTETCKNIAVGEQQGYNIELLFSQFDELGIDYMPLKGSLLKKMYPKSEMRIMGDVDILIKTEQYDIIKPIMEKFGYTEKVESDHELTWYKVRMCVELHKRLIPSYNKDYYAYFGDGWRLAKIKNGTRYSMTNEDQMIYLFTHFAKHYRDAGIGIRHIVDLWVYRKNVEKLDEVYVVNELKKLQLSDFYANIIATLDNWFEEGEETPVTDFITQIIFNSGIYGTREAHVLSDAFKATKASNKMSIRSDKFISRIFPSCTAMTKRYYILKTLPFLLPIMWLVRCIDILLFGRDKIALRAQDFKTATTEKIFDYGDSLNFVGLDFNFKE